MIPYILTLFVTNPDGFCFVFCIVSFHFHQFSLLSYFELTVSLFSLVVRTLLLILTGEYDANRCSDGNCEPCYLSHASCKGMPDGLNPWVGKEWTPEYAVCRKERVVYTGRCGIDERGMQKLFDPENRECIKKIILSGH